MVLIAGILASAYFVETLSQNANYNNSISENNQLYNDAVKEQRQLDLDVQAESINVTSPPIYSASANSVSVTVDLQNDGPIFVEVKTLWVHGIRNSKYGFVSLGYQLQPSNNKSFTVNVAVQGAVPEDTNQFYGWIVTARGKTIQLYPAHQTGPQGPTGQNGTQGPPGATGDVGPEGPPSDTALVSQGIGSISMDFKSYNSYPTDYTNHLGAPNPSFTFARTARLSFSINVTNLDPSHSALNLTSNCQFWIFSPASGAIKGVVWTIATVSGTTITPLPSNQFIILPYNQTTTLYFGPNTAGNNNLDVGITAVNLVLTGRIGAVDYGQNLPFISLIAT